MIKIFLINILLKLLNIPSSKKVQEKRIEKFLWTAYPQQGFIDYVMKRDISLLQQMGNGVNREEYLILLGQRSEVGLLLSIAKRSYKKVESERQERIQAVKDKINKDNKQKNENITDKKN